MLYRVLISGWVSGKYRRAGEQVDLTEAQAKYERVEAVPNKTVASSRKTSRRRSKE